MAKTITQINTTTDTFEIFVNRTNEAINAISTEVVTANNNANGAQVTGNSFLNGTFGANVVTVYNSIRGGNVQTSAALTIISNTVIGNSHNLFLGTGTANAVANTTNVRIQNTTGSAILTIPGLSVTLGSNSAIVNTLIYAIGNSTVNATVNSVSFRIANSTVNFVITKPTAAQVSAGTYYLNANGSWSLSGVGGSTTQVQFNDAGVANGSSNFTFNKTTSTLTVSGVLDDTGANTPHQTLSDGATINWNTASGRVATVTLGGNRTMAAPTNLKVGTYILHVIQDGTGSRTLAWNAVFKFPAGVDPVLTTTAGARDVLSFVSDGTNLYGTLSIPNAS